MYQTYLKDVSFKIHSWVSKALKSEGFDIDNAYKKPPMTDQFILKSVPLGVFRIRVNS
jgi:hypothetical protein